MSRVLFGIVDRIHPPTSPGPGARLRPFWETSPDKTRWQSPTEEFPNTGLVSWWQPPSDVARHSAWYFQIEESSTYDPNKPQHDYFRVRGTPSMGLELLDLEQASDEDELREYLLGAGIPAALLSSRRVVFRQRSGSFIGPIDLVVRNGLYYADERQLELPVTLSHPRSDLSLAEWSNHYFLPPEEWSTRIGELDFSSDEVFLKRVLRELKKFTPSLVDDVKLTDKLISRYCTALETASLSPVQRHRLQRLKKIAQHARQDVHIPAEALDDFLSISSIAKLLEEIKKKAAEETIASTQASLSKLHEQRTRLEQEAATLNADIGQRRRELISLEQQHSSALEEFQTQAKQRFRALSNDASEFLAEITLIRAALNLPNPASHGNHVVPDIFPAQATSQVLGPGDFLGRISHSFANKNLGCVTSTSLLASMASGFVPLVVGSLGSESLSMLGHTLAADRVYWLPLNPTLTSPSQLRREVVIQESEGSGGTGSLDDLLQRALTSSELSILVLENINLAQVDSVLLPLIRQYVELRCRSVAFKRPPVCASTAVGSWPANLLLAGSAIESPLSLPMSTELWSYATFVDAGKQSTCQHENTESSSPDFPGASHLLYETWAEWLNQIESNAATDSMMLSEYLGHQVAMSSLVRQILRKLGSAIEVIMGTKTSVDKLKLFAELAVIPFCLSHGLNVRTILEGCPHPVIIDGDAVTRIDSVFKHWGIDLA